MIGRAIIGAVFVWAAYAESISADLPAISTDLENSEAGDYRREEDRKAWKARFILSMTNDPRGYDALQGMRNEPTKRRREMYVRADVERQRAMAEARNTRTIYLETASELATPFPGPGVRATMAEVSRLQSAENEVYKLQKSEEQRKHLLSQEIGNKPSDLENLAERLSQFEYSQRPLTQREAEEMAMLDYLRKNRPDLPQGPFARDELIYSSSMPADVVALLQDDDLNAKVFVQNIMNMSNFTFQFPKESENVRSDVRLLVEKIQGSSFLTDEERDLLKRYSLVLRQQERLRAVQVHNDNVSELKDVSFLLKEAGRFLFPESAEVKSALTFYSSSVTFYESLGDMALSGVSTGSLGLFISGLNALSTLGGAKPTTDEIVIEMLEEVQASLDDIRKTQLRQSVELEKLSQSVAALRARNKARFDELRSLVLEDTESMRKLIQDSFTDLSLDLTLRSLGSLVDSIRPNHPSVDGRLRVEFLECVSEPKHCSEDARRRLTNVALHAGEIYNLVSGELKNKPYLSAKKSLSEFSTKAAVDAFSVNSSIDARLGPMLDSMVRWLDHQHDSLLSESAGFSQDTTQSQLSKVSAPPYSVLSKAFAQRGDDGKALTPSFELEAMASVYAPSLITERLVPEYQQAVELLPSSEGLHGDTRHVRDMQNVVDSISSLSSDMRALSPVAAAVFVKKFYDFRVEIDKLKRSFAFPKVGDVPVSPFGAPQMSLAEIAELYRDDINFVPVAQTIYSQSSVELTGSRRAIISPEDHRYHSMLVKTGVLELHHDGPNGSGASWYALSSKGRLVYETLVNTGRLPNGVLDPAKIAPHYVAVWNKSFTSDSLRFPVQKVEEKKALMQIALHYIDRERKERMILLSDELSNDRIEQVLLEMAISKLTLDTLVMGGFGECAFTSRYAAPYSGNVLFISDWMYGIVTDVEKYNPEDGYLRFMEIEQPIGLNENLVVQMLASTLGLPEFKVGYEECRLGLGRTVIANQKLETIRLFDPKYKID